MRFVYPVQAGERNFFTSFSHNLGPTFYCFPVCHIGCGRGRLCVWRWVQGKHFNINRLARKMEGGKRRQATRCLAPLELKIKNVQAFLLNGDSDSFPSSCPLRMLHAPKIILTPAPSPPLSVCPLFMHSQSVDRRRHHRQCQNATHRDPQGHRHCEPRR